MSSVRLSLSGGTKATALKTCDELADAHALCTGRNELPVLCFRNVVMIAVEAPTSQPDSFGERVQLIEGMITREV